MVFMKCLSLCSQMNYSKEKREPGLPLTADTCLVVMKEESCYDRDSWKKVCLLFLNKFEHSPLLEILGIDNILV